MRKITLDQTPARQDERDRIMNNGGWITCKNGVHRVDGELAVSRAIGDRNIKKFIIAEPEVYHHTLEADDDMLILSSDGLMLVYKEEALAKTIS